MTRARLLILVLLLIVASLCAAQVRAARPGYVIAGTAVDDRTGHPLGVVSVSIAAVTQREDVTSVVTSTDGKFRFEGLVAGKYSLTAKRRGYSVQSFEQHENYSSAIVVGEGQDATKLVFRMHPDASIHGKIVDEMNEPVANMDVRLYSTRNDLGTRSTRRVANVATNDLGEYSFGHLEAGTYYIVALGRPWYAGESRQSRMMRARNQQDRSDTPEHEERVNQERERLDLVYPITLYDNVQDWTQASAIDLSPGDRFTADFHVSAVHAASLRIAAAPQEPPVGWTQPTAGRMGARMRRSRPAQLFIKMFDDQLVLVNTTMSGFDGMLVVNGIAPGRYVVKADSEDGHASMQEVDIIGDMDLPKITQGTGTTVKGKFIWEGAPLQGGFGVMLTNEKRQRNYVLAQGPNGEFQVPESVMPGKYELAAGSNGGEVYVKSVEIGGVVSGAKVQIPEGTEINMTVTLGRGTGTIDGTALLDGKPKAGVMVVLVPAEGWVSVTRFRRDQTDSDGTFTLRNVIPGKYKVVALKDGWKLPWSDAKVMQGFLKEGTAVEITSSGKANISVNVK